MTDKSVGVTAIQDISLFGSSIMTDYYDNSQTESSIVSYGAPLHFRLVQTESHGGLTQFAPTTDE